jgi:hypothetical protein
MRRSTEAPSRPGWPPLPARPALSEGMVDVVWVEIPPSDRRAAARRALRQILARYLDADPRSIRLADGEGGKPQLDPASPAMLRFNLSHSADAALYAVSIDLEVGIDLEIRHRRVDEVAIAKRVVGSKMAQRLARLDPDAREREFLLAWVRHEAALKCRGVGLAAAKAGDGREPPWVTAWELGPRAAAALACEREPSEIRPWRWPAS